jgi:hypothetical protein
MQFLVERNEIPFSFVSIHAWNYRFILICKRCRKLGMITRQNELVVGFVAGGDDFIHGNFVLVGGEAVPSQTLV